MLKRRVNEARGRLLERDSASTRSAKSLNVLENEAEHHNTKEILQAQHSVTGEMPVEDAKSGASDVDVKSEPAQPPLVRDITFDTAFFFDKNTTHSCVLECEWRQSAVADSCQSKCWPSLSHAAPLTRHSQRLGIF